VKVLQVARATGHTGVETIKQLDDCPRLPAPLLQKLKSVAAHAGVRVRTQDAEWLRRCTACARAQLLLVTRGANDADLRPTRPAPMPATAEYSMTGQRFSNRLCRRWCACSSCTCGRSGHTVDINGGARPCWRSAQKVSHRDRNAEAAAFTHQLAGPRGSLRRWRKRR
jgi:hypothetical protein